MGQLRVASYCTTFLKSEMLHIYRQVTSLRRAQTFVMTKKVEHPRRFSFDDIERIPRPHRNLLRHGWIKFVERRPPLIYRGEYQMLVSILGRRGADMMHIYFGHTGVHLLPFIRAFAAFVNEFPNSEFVVAGKGPLQPDLQALARQLGVARKVHFCGFLSQPDLRELYAQSHIFIHPSETQPDQDQEGVPNSVLEAMATGLPVIATRHGGIPEAVTENLNGFLSDEGDTESLGRSMVALANSPEIYARFSAAARQAVGENSDQEMTIRALGRIYEEVCDRRMAREPRLGEVELPAPLIESAVAK